MAIKYQDQETLQQLKKRNEHLKREKEEEAKKVAAILNDEKRTPFTPEEWRELAYQHNKEQLKEMEPFTFRSFNYTYDYEDRLYYPFYELELYKQSKGAKPQGMEPDRYLHLREKEAKYKELLEKVQEYENGKENNDNERSVCLLP